MDRDQLLEDVLRQLKRVGKPNAEGWQDTRCPFHAGEDKHPSFRVNVHNGAWKDWHDGDGGGLRSLAERLGLEIAVKAPLTVADLAREKGLPESYLRGRGVYDDRYGVHIPYLDAGGETVARRRRSGLGRGQSFSWRKGDKVQPYGLDRLDRERPVVVVEGESDQWTLDHHGFNVLGIPGAGTWRPEWAEHLRRCPKVHVWQEPGDAGAAFVERIGASLPEVVVVEAPPEAKDPSALYLWDRDGFKGKLTGMLAAGQPYRQRSEAERRREAEEAYAQARELLEDPKLMERVVEAVHGGGVVGEEENVQLLYLVATSRLLPGPMAAAVKGGSASGKSALVGGVLVLVPEEEKVMRTGGSPKSLIYDPADFRHKVLVLVEAEHLGGGDFAYLVRTLLSEKVIEYGTAEVTPEGVRHRLISKAGPAAFISTTVRHSIEAQAETRLVTLTVREDPEQTERVKERQARAAMETLPAVELGPFHALQRWLALAGERWVVVPYADWLAANTPDEPLRMRRDFPQLLAVIEASAVLHQCQRERNGEGAILATAEDYALAYRVFREAFQTAAQAGLTAAMRRVVETVVELVAGTEARVKVVQVAEALSITRQVAHRQIRGALSLGHLVNEEQRKGFPAQLRPGQPLPEAVAALPSPEGIGYLEEEG